MSGVRRSLKNVKKNFAPCERDVREATSNDKKLASAVVMARISNATYDIAQSPLVMAMLWKRLNDMGKNWRHCYKGLLLLDYLLKTGADHIVSEVKTNIFAIETLLEFTYVDSRGVDKGINVREQAKLTMALLNDTSKLEEERERALAAHRRLTSNIGTKAEPKPIPHSRAAALKGRTILMPNGEAAPDPREVERRQIEEAQKASAAEFIERGGVYTDEPIAAVAAVETAPNGSLSALASEEEQLAYALRISALESGSPLPDSVSPSGSESTPRTREEEELALAISLSMREARTHAANVVDSDNESDADSVTPPSTPYTGEFFNPDMHGYADVESSSEFGITPNDAIPGSPHHMNPPTSSGGGNTTGGLGTHMEASELEAYLALEASLGAQQVS